MGVGRVEDFGEQPAGYRDLGELETPILGMSRFYTLATAGKKQLGVEESRFSEMFGAIMRVMKTT